MLLIFVSGKVVLTGALHLDLSKVCSILCLCVFHSHHCLVHVGAKQREDLFAAFEKIYPVLQEFRKGAMQIPQAAAAPLPVQVSVQSCSRRGM